ncbi:glutathione S-transferase [Variovorax sp. GrIS 2.14]|uniref:glutathione S-transferase family protein n=1 Tax=Variovorax sp. GrIS 2.14 TaxID=3071709 RepID=UPI0038F61B11
MQIFYSTTSPFARIARIALAEKGCRELSHRLTDPWKDSPELLLANPSARVPTVVLDSGLPLTESLLIVLWLEAKYPNPSLLGDDPGTVISTAGIAMGAIEAAAAVIIGRKMTDAAFDESPVGLRRRRSIIQAMSRLEANPPDSNGPLPSLALITTVVALDYLRFRFAKSSWLPLLPKLDALALAARSRSAFAETLPHDMPVS